MVRVRLPAVEEVCEAAEGFQLCRQPPPLRTPPVKCDCEASDDRGDEATPPGDSGRERCETDDSVGKSLLMARERVPGEPGRLKYEAPDEAAGVAVLDEDELPTAGGSAVAVARAVEAACRALSGDFATTAEAAAGVGGTALCDSAPSACADAGMRDRVCFSD